MVHPPCYDTSKQTDCKLRAINCRSTCPAWKRYEKAKAIEYAEREKKRNEYASQIEYERRVSQRIERRNHKR